MTIEEKARAYDKALNIAREILDHTSENYLCTHLTKEDIKDMYIRFFPELEESEDEKIRKSLISYLHGLGEFDYPDKKTYNDWLKWVEKQKSYVSPQMVADAYLRGCNETEEKLLEKQGEQKASYTTTMETGNGGINALVTRELSTNGYSEQKPTWSKKDEEMLVDAYVMLDWYKGNNWWTARHIKDWLKSLKERCTWKPSDEQLEALKNAIHIKPFKNPSDSILWGLYEQLNKLKS